jgi:RecA/RadA recombinase
MNVFFSYSLDTILDGGYKRGEIFEITGPSAVGKTQVCIYSLNSD